MALSARLMLRQGQSLVMTPQLLQAIKLLQFSNQELTAFVEEELERNPLLERVEDDFGPIAGEQPMADAADTGSADGDWADSHLEIDTLSLERNLDTDLGNTFEADRAPTPGDTVAASEGQGLSATAWSGTSGGAAEGANLEAYVASEMSLHEHLHAQLALAITDPTDRLIGHALVECIDPSGYLTESLDAIGDRLGIDPQRAEKVLAIVQDCEPSGVGARDLAECCAIQLKERNRYDPAMAALLAHLPLLARRDFAALRRLCGVDADDLADMIAEIRALDPKPGRAFGDRLVQPVVPDVTVRAAADGSWHVELNPEGLPRVLVNQTYAARVSQTAGTTTDKSFVATCLQTANWLTKSLEQRARTILKVSTEIVRQQDAFFAHGVAHLRPLNLKTIADAIGMHESTVSRVTSNKYMASPRGLFELKYFFTASISSSSGGEAHSAESVRFRIKQLIDGEGTQSVLSDDAIVVRLKEAHVDIARRTVAKYRESLRIPSSVERRREKLAAVASPSLSSIP